MKIPDFHAQSLQAVKKGMVIIMSKIRERLLYELTREPKARKIVVQDFAKRLLIGFFVMMILLTFVSRAADSITVAKISVGTVKRGELKFEIEGNGMIEEKAEKYLDIYEGVRIKAIYAKVGQKAEKGDMLFQYDDSDLLDKLKTLETELKKAELDYEKEKLSYEAATAESTIEAAELTLERAKLDLLTAKDDLKAAKEAVLSAKEEEYQKAKRAYDKANKNYNELEADKSKSIEKATKVVKEAQEEFDEIYKDKKEAQTVMEDYKAAVKSQMGTSTGAAAVSSNNANIIPITGSSDLTGNSIETINTTFSKIYQNIISSNKGLNKEIGSAYSNIGNTTSDQIKNDAVSKAETNIFKAYYGEKEYISHQREVAKAEKVLERSKQDYVTSIVTAAEGGQILTTATKIACIRTLQDASQTLIEITEKDNELTKLISDYCQAIKENNQLDIDKTYTELFSFLYIEDDTKKMQIKAADKAVAAAQDALVDTTEEWTRKMEEANANVDDTKEAFVKADKNYQLLISNTYNYSSDVNTEEKMVTTAQRAWEDSQANLKKVKNNDNGLEVKENTKKQIMSLDYELNDIEIQKKQEAVDEMKEIINADGKVTAPIAGIITKLGFEVGSAITGADKVTFATDEFGFKALITKDEAKRIAVGDELGIRIGDSMEVISVAIENVGLENAEGKIEISGIMPEGNYSVGSAAYFKVTKQSKEYSQTIPIQAIRTDSKEKNYVLITAEENTILGNEVTARRVDINIIDKDYSTAAIEGSLYSEDKLITSSSKNIEEGDRIRVEENNDKPE